MKHGVKHEVHQVRRKQIDSHKECSKCPSGRQMRVQFTFLTLSQFFHSRNVTAAQCVSAWSAASRKTIKPRQPFSGNFLSKLSIPLRFQFLLRTNQSPSTVAFLLP